MSETLSSLREMYGDRVEQLQDLVAYFDSISSGQFAGHEDVEVNLIDPQRCVTMSQEFGEFHPLFEPLELLILDEPGTSDYHCYAPGLPVPGAVIFVSHDGRPAKIVFANLEAFVHAATTAIGTKVCITEFHTDDLTLCPDQQTLNDSIREGFESYEEYDAESAVILMLQASDLSDVDLMTEIANDENFYFGEAIAERIVAKPTAEMIEIATACANHSHPQVSSPGKRALEAVRSLS